MNLVGMSTKGLVLQKRGAWIKIKIPSYINYSQKFGDTLSLN